MRFPFKLSSCLSLAIVAAFSLGRTDAATLCGVSGAESSAELLADVAGDGALSGDSLVLFQNASSRVASSWMNSDPASAAAYVASMAESDGRGAASYFLAISMGSSESISGVRDEALRLAMERWIADSGEGESEQEIIESGRGRGRGGESTDREIALNWINSNPSPAVDPSFGSGSPISAVPEPSATLLGALGILGLLHRRRA